MGKTTFTATDGNKYSLEYDLPLVRDVRKEIDVDLLTNEGIQKAAGNVIDFAEVLWHSVRKQAERQGVDEADFVRSITPIVDECADAWLEALSRFFDKIGRSALARLAAAMVRVDRADRADANKLVDEATARRISDQQVNSSTANRRRQLSELLGDDESENLSTAGASSDN